MSVDLVLLCSSYLSTAPHFYGLDRYEYGDKQFATKHLKRIMSVCVLVRIRRCPGGPLFSVGPSNPFKSALLIPLSSHSRRGVMPPHTSILSAVHRPAFFRSLQKSADIFF